MPSTELLADNSGVEALSVPPSATVTLLVKSTEVFAGKIDGGVGSAGERVGGASVLRFDGVVNIAVVGAISEH